MGIARNQELRLEPDVEVSKAFRPVVQDADLAIQIPCSGKNGNILGAGVLVDPSRLISIGGKPQTKQNSPRIES